MAVTRDNLDNFSRFASERLDHGGARSMLELAVVWQSEHVRASSNAAIRQSLEEMTAGLSRLADEVMGELRAELGLIGE